MKIINIILGTLALASCSKEGTESVTLNYEHDKKLPAKCNINTQIDGISEVALIRETGEFREKFSIEYKVVRYGKIKSETARAYDGPEGSFCAPLATLEGQKTICIDPSYPTIHPNGKIYYWTEDFGPRGNVNNWKTDHNGCE